MCPKMGSRFGALCLLLTLAAKGQALTCTSCVSLGASSTICTSSSSVQCSSSEVCATTYRKFTSQNGGVTYDVIRACAPIEKCNKVGSLSYSNDRITMGVGCCSSDSCTPDLPQLTQDSSVSNGIQCGTCSSSLSTDCQPTGSMMCGGNEIRCVAYSMSSNTGLASVYRGCGTQSLCDFQHYTAILTGSTVEHSFTCSSSSSSSGALTCTSCVSLDASSTTCASSTSVQCSSSEVCATTFRKFTFQNVVTYDIIRSCAPKEKCNMVGGLSYSNVKVTMGIGCCSTDSCTPDLPQLTQDSSASNGVQCGTCSSSSSTVCQPTGNITCTGQETRCVAYSVSSTGLASVSQGCGTQSLCDVQHFTAILSGSTVEHRFICSGAHSILSGGITPGIILIAVISVILMNRSI